MKEYIKILMIILLIGFYSCDQNLLDTRPLDKFAEEDVWSDVNLSRAFLNNIYDDVLGMYFYDITDDWTDNVMMSEFGMAANSLPRGGLLSYVKAGVFTSAQDVGWNQFAKIRKCNLAIEKLTGNESILEPDRKIMIAEAKMLRAMTYYWLAQRFGGCIIVDKVLTPEDELQLSRSSETETYDFIINDLEEAAIDLPESADQGRLTKYAADAFLSRVALQDGRYDKVIQACNEVENGPFVLDDYYNICKDYSTIISSPEVILSMEREQTHNTFGQTLHQRFLPGISNSSLDPNVPTRLGDAGFGGWLALFPPQELVDDYLFVEGNNTEQHRGEEFIGEHPGLMWPDRDARFEISIVHDSSVWFNQLVTIRKGGNAFAGAWPAVPSQQTYSGYYFRKFTFENETQGYPTPCNYALPLLRLGEVYLNKAEAYYRKGDLDLAIEYTNKTRTEHGKLPPIMNVSSDEFYKNYKIERRIDLLYENDRYWSLLRWAKVENASSIPELEGQYHCLVIGTDGLVDIQPWVHLSYSMVFEYPKRKYFPIPDAEVLNNPNLTQNPGW